MKAVLDHVGIAVSDLQASLAFFKDVLGLHVEASEEIASQRVRATFLNTGQSTFEMLEATAARPTLTLRNTTEFQVGYMVVDKDQMVVALYPPCGDNCPKLQQGASVAIPYANIGGYTNASTEAVVMWWTYTRQADGSLKATGAVQTKNIRL